MKLMKNGHATHQIGYHIVFCVKFRHKILINEVEMVCKRIIAEVCIDNKWKLQNLEIMPDHVHLFIQVDPLISPSRIVQIIKSISAVKLFSTFKKLKANKFWGTGLWSKSYYVGTAGNMSKNIIQKYINNQKSNSSTETSSRGILGD